MVEVTDTPSDIECLRFRRLSHTELTGCPMEWMAGVTVDDRILFWGKKLLTVNEYYIHNGNRIRPSENI